MDEIVERIVVAIQLDAGMTPAEILVVHYDNLACRSRTAGHSRMAGECRAARDAVAGVKTQFFIDIAKAVGTSLTSVVRLFEDRGVVKFFRKIGWSLERFWKMLREGWNGARKFAGVVFDYVREEGVVRWTRDEIYKFDKWLSKPENRRTKLLIGSLLGVILLYLWWKEADTGDLAFDWDISEVAEAVTGNYNVSSFLMGPDGMQLMSLIAAGVSGLSFPWPGATAVHFVGSVITTLYKVVGQYMEKAKEEQEEEAKRLGLA